MSKAFSMPDEISLILNDRESGSVLLLNRLIKALENELHRAGLGEEAFSKQVNTLRKKLSHFAAIEHFLASLILQIGRTHDFPGEALQFLEDYRLYWHDSDKKIANNFLQHCNPEGKTILTHSHSQTIISLLYQLHERNIPFRVLQTLSSPGEEGKLSLERMRQSGLRADLIDDASIKEAIAQTDFILLGCDALLPTKFLNKIGSLVILEQAKQHNKLSFLVTESRKEIACSSWEKGLAKQVLFEWVPLHLINRIITEQQI